MEVVDDALDCAGIEDPVASVGRHHRVGMGARGILDEAAQAVAIPALEARGVEARPHVGAHGGTGRVAHLVAGDAIAEVGPQEDLAARRGLARRGTGGEESGRGNKAEGDRHQPSFKAFSASRSFSSWERSSRRRASTMESS